MVIRCLYPYTPIPLCTLYLIRSSHKVRCIAEGNRRRRGDLIFDLRRRRGDLIFDLRRRKGDLILDFLCLSFAYTPIPLCTFGARGTGYGNPKAITPIPLYPYRGDLIFDFLCLRHRKPKGSLAKKG